MSRISFRLGTRFEEKGDDLSATVAFHKGGLARLLETAPLHPRSVECNLHWNSHFCRVFYALLSSSKVSWKSPGSLPLARRSGVQMARMGSRLWGFLNGPNSCYCEFVGLKRKGPLRIRLFSIPHPLFEGVHNVLYVSMISVDASGYWAILRAPSADFVSVLTSSEIVDIFLLRSDLRD